MRTWRRHRRSWQFTTWLIAGRATGRPPGGPPTDLRQRSPAPSALASASYRDVDDRRRVTLTISAKPCAIDGGTPAVLLPTDRLRAGSGYRQVQHTHNWQSECTTVLTPRAMTVILRKVLYKFLNIIGMNDSLYLSIPRPSSNRPLRARKPPERGRLTTDCYDRRSRLRGGSLRHGGLQLTDIRVLQFWRQPLLCLVK